MTGRREVGVETERCELLRGGDQKRGRLREKLDDRKMFGVEADRCEL